MKVRHYGIEVGNRVSHTIIGTTLIGVVDSLDSLDNNHAYLKLDDGRIVNITCEHCKVLDEKEN